MASGDKPDTKFRACRKGCGERFWAERPGTCPACKAILAEIAADNQEHRRRQASRPRVGAAYTRGRGMSAHMRGAC